MPRMRNSRNPAKKVAVSHGISVPSWASTSSSSVTRNISAARAKNRTKSRPDSGRLCSSVASLRHSTISYVCPSKSLRYGFYFKKNVTFAVCFPKKVSFFINFSPSVRGLMYFRAVLLIIYGKN